MSARRVSVASRRVSERSASTFNLMASSSCIDAAEQPKELHTPVTFFKIWLGKGWAPPLAGSVGPSES